MGLKETVNAGVLTAFKAIGNLNKPMTFKATTGNMTRDLDAGTSVPETVSYTLKFSVFAKWTEAENNKDASTLTTSKLLFPRGILAVVPKASDILVDEDGHIWEIVKNMSDPADALVKLQVRTSR